MILQQDGLKITCCSVIKKKKKQSHVEYCSQTNLRGRVHLKNKISTW